MAKDTWEPRYIRTEKPTPARMYDYYLGGKDNFAVDRAAAEEVIAAAPETPRLCRENRLFLRRAVHFLVAEAGIRQFVDLGTGLPSQGHVHEIAHELAPDARVVYVDNDPIVITHGRALIKTETTAIIEADLRRPQEVLRHRDLRRLIHFNEPVGVLLVSMLQFVTDAEDPWGIVARFREMMSPGSYLVLSTINMPEHNPEPVIRAAEVYQKATSPAILRTRKQILRFFDGFELLEPGLVHVPAWRPYFPDAAKGAEKIWLLGGVGRKT